MSNLLKHLTVFPIRHPNGDPFFYVQMCVKDRGRIRPFAWYDNMGVSPQLRRANVPLLEPIPLLKVTEAVTSITGTEATPEALHAHLLDLARVKLADMQASLEAGSRKYESSHFSDSLAGLLSRPGYGTKRTTQMHRMVLEGIPLDRPEEYSDWFDSELMEKPKPWEWDDYVEHPDLSQMLTSLSIGVRPIPLIFHDMSAFPNLANTQREIIRIIKPDERRMSSPKARLSYVKDMGYNLLHKKPFPAMAPAPFPMDALSIKQIAQLDAAAMTQLLADCYTWMSFYYIMKSAHETTGSKQPKRGWGTVDEKAILMCYYYQAENNRVTEGEGMIYYGIEELPKLAESFGCEYIRPSAAQANKPKDPHAGMTTEEIAEVTIAKFAAMDKVATPSEGGWVND